MLRIFICEDNPTYLAEIKKHVENYILMRNLAMKVVCAEASPYLILKYLEEKPPETGLYFLDLHLECDMNGIALASEIRKHDPQGYIVFITSDAESYKLTFKHKVEAMDYIVKHDFNIKQRIHECIATAEEAFTSKTTSQQDKFIFKISHDIKRFRDGFDIAKDSTIVLDTQKIICFVTEADIKHMVTVYTTDGRLQFAGSLKQVEAELDKNRFYKCQANLIINLDKVEAVDPVQRVVVLENNLRFTIAFRTVKKLNERINNYVREVR